MWRLEPETDHDANPRVLVQSRGKADWARIGTGGWFAHEPDPALDLLVRLGLDSLHVGQRFRYRLRGNPCISRKGKRYGLFRPEEQESWLSLRGQRLGFSVASAHLSQERILSGKRNGGQVISVFSVLFDGVLVTTDPEKLREAVCSGVGHGKALGLGLLSVVPM